MKRFLCLVAIVFASACWFTGCAALLVGAAAGAGGMAYSQGELRNTESVALADAHKAAERAVKDLKFAVIKSQVDGLAGVIEARTASDQKVTIKTKQVSIKVCPECWEPDQPQLQLGMYPVYDPQAVREPRPDVSYLASGTSGLQINLTGIGPDGIGGPEMGSRQIQWGWNPVGGSSFFDVELTPNYLVATTSVGTVSVT